ncbi:ABC transporter permease [Mahella australiensis]|uniref:Carbohydrate ABC transporter membrane protein 1, CUT1 family n=1 Tax=Mahella australiensis (strain DSM 15567 / CIP 107919 / 50-1 BON) TaxID=697281 RepID=F4A186_MAHA5|nr:ABC transporter permease subunit [Mahella australiensis]AEE97005.1 carbohydrate ABC transporter membrane protein 1, CUT1 family [Mahella australiensis 50-1 BON]
MTAKVESSGTIALPNKKQNRWKLMKKSSQLYLIILLPVIYILVFNYYPMYGAQIAFRDYMPTKGIWSSPWVGLDNFARFFRRHDAWRIIGNTLSLSVYQLIAGFPIPIILALSLNSTKDGMFKKSVQTITYAPHFISTVVMVGIVMQFLSPRIGIINKIIEILGGTPTDFMGKSQYFGSIYVWSGVWQSTGWGSIIYLAALAGIDPSLHEAAIVDGASRFQRIIHIDIPGIMPTAIILLIMNAGQIMNIGFEKVFLMQNPLNLRSSEIISTYVYKMGLASSAGDFSYSTAIGLFNSVVNFVLIVTVNQIAKRVGEVSLW